MIIPDEQMEPFIKLCDIKDSGLEYLGEDGPQFHKGDRVRVIDGIMRVTSSASNTTGAL